ncbi:MAG: glycosyltransferase family 2 protein [Bacteroidales bacterium]|nr:glycosyltransferase family 2 protein [Bacteroidales bacterium]
MDSPRCGGLGADIAVIILNWNGAALLRQYLPSVVANTPSDIARVIVADNGSTDDSLRVLAEEFPGVKVLPFSENYGYAKGYNVAIDQTRYRYTVLLNSDVETPPGWLRPLYEYMEANPDVAACQPKILSWKERGRFEYAGAAGGYLDRHGYPYCRGRVFDKIEDDHGQYDTPAEIHWASGAALMVRSDEFLAVGGLDPRFFAHMEEIDLCWRLLRRGHKVMAVPQGAVYHLGGGSLPAGNPRKTYLNFRNNLLLIYKNLSRKDGRRLLFKRRLLDTLAWGKFIVTFDLANANAILRAHRDYRRMRASYTPAPDATPNFLASQPDILLQYYFGHQTPARIGPQTPAAGASR